MSSDRKINQILVANRGEIAVRVIRAARARGIKSVAVYSEVDAGTLPTRLADLNICLGGSRAAESYLNGERIIEAALQTGSDAVHPGYGFLSENADFAKAVREAGLIYIGPPEEAVRQMADKELARNTVSAKGVPVLTACASQDPLEKIKLMKFPLLVKAVSGGSGRGMRRVGRAEDLEGAMEAAAREAKAAFGDERVIVERFLENPRHIEVQIFGDEAGNYLHFGERECSVQRRHQKLLEEAPAPCLHASVRKRLFEAALLAAESVAYVGAGTAEFLVEGGEEKGAEIWFLEMNTRIQVEHPVTEEVWGRDLVGLQIDVAEGKSFPFKQSDLSARGHAIEFRVYAEEVSENFAARTGKLSYVSSLGGPGFREDGWVESGSRVSSFYDSLLTKLIVSGANREEALSRAKAVLAESVIEGLPSTLDFHRWLLEQKDFCEGKLHIHWLESNYSGEKKSSLAVGPLVTPVREEGQS